MKQLRSNQLFWPFLALTAVLAGLFSLAVGLRQEVWFDEIYSVTLAQRSFGEIARLTAQDVHPPVYYWLLKVWMSAFGSGELALRSMSALFFGASIAMAGLLARRLFGAKTALTALPFVAFAPFLLRYGYEIRMYAFVSCVGIVATYVLVRAVDEVRRQRRWLLFAIYALLVALGVYTLYFMALVWLAHLAWLLRLAYKQKRPDIAVHGIVAYTVSFLLFVPWLPAFLSKANGGTLSPVTHSLGFDNLLGIMTFSFLYHPPWQLGFWNSLAVFAAAVAVLYLGVKGYKNASSTERQYLVLLGMYVAVPILLLIIVTHITPIYLERYIAHFIIGGYLFIGVATALALRGGNRLALLPAGILAVVTAVGCIHMAQYGNYNFQRLHKPVMKEVSAMLSCKDGAVVFANNPQVAVELGYFVKDCPIYFYNETLKMGGGFAMLSGSPLRVADPVRQFKDTSRLQYVYYDKPERSLPLTLKMTDKKTIENVSIATYVHG